MKTIETIRKELGYDFSVPCPIVVKKIIYAYKGTEVRIFKDLAEAHKFSSNVGIENDTVEKTRYDAWWDIRRQQEKHVERVWNDELRREYDTLSDEMFKLCLDFALAACSNVLDHTAKSMAKVVQLVSTAITINKDGK